MIYTTKVQIGGVTCSACQKVIMRRLKTIAGIQEVSVQLENGETTIISSLPVTVDDINRSLQDTHYKAI